MTPVPQVFVARLVGLPVLGPDGDSVGRVRDVVISIPLPGRQPRALGLAVELTTRRQIFVPMLRVTSIKPAAVTLSTGRVNLRSLQLRTNEALAIDHVLDTKARTDDPDHPELHGTDLTVIDLAISRNHNQDWMVSSVALRSGRKGLRRRGETIVVEWVHVLGLTLSADQPGHGLHTALAQFEGMRPADVANVLRGLPDSRRDQLASAMDDERLADILQEFPDEDQTEVIQSLGRERAANVLEAMDPDDAADLLAILPDDERQAMLDEMDPEDSESVRRLLRHSPDTAGGIMTPEPITVTPSATVAEAIARVRKSDVTAAAANMVFVVRPPTSTPTGKYLGCIHLQALLREPPANLVSGIIDAGLPGLDPDDSLQSVTRFFATYNLICAPVLDAARHLLGAVTVDDLLDALLPQDWRADEPEAQNA